MTTATEQQPVLHKVTRRNGIAGQFEVIAAVEYPAEEIRIITFVGSVYGGPVVMVTEDNTQVFVKDPERFGTFGTEWVERFFA